ncbi:acetoin utilization protein AcuB [Pseudidiomarina planktonica]|uniref:Acetoin utilization protein AcuB n=1 Tax=Pseudidiomarina planktonica TaxID=1323738 RepID=A0A1Y6G1P9_9GAMM|nr:CBS domain-containing protein [Pseudidiomarina planktonica]RUO63264.1 CBS domain-containing protein [Pseudidiomarina planktonica]SMQ80522.1 acetoin utilization protein AcuB [Pseudidiomarina planktonica]
MSLLNIMTRQVTTIGMDETLETLQHIFSRNKFHHVLVVDGTQLVGVVSDRDLLKALSPNLGTAAETMRDLATLNKKVHQVMQRELRTLPPTAGIYDAVRLFNRERVSCIPIMDESRKPVGILSWRDIMRALELQQQRKQQVASD